MHIDRDKTLDQSITSLACHTHTLANSEVGGRSGTAVFGQKAWNRFILATLQLKENKFEFKI